MPTSTITPVNLIPGLSRLLTWRRLRQAQANASTARAAAGSSRAAILEAEKNAAIAEAIHRKTNAYHLAQEHTHPDGSITYTDYFKVGDDTKGLGNPQGFVKYLMDEAENGHHPRISRKWDILHEAPARKSA